MPISPKTSSGIYLMMLTDKEGNTVASLGLTKM
jgi:hypothetical protein